MKITKKVFGKFNEEEVITFTIINRNNVSIKLMTLGASLIEFLLPKENEEFDNIGFLFIILNNI
jgi:hypothetical protein